MYQKNHTYLDSLDVDTGQEIRRFEGHTDWVRSVAFSPDGQTILSGSADNTLIWWEAASGRRLRQFEGHTAQIYSAAFSADGKYALSGSADSSVILWDIGSGRKCAVSSGTQATCVAWPSAG